MQGELTKEQIESVHRTERAAEVPPRAWARNGIPFAAFMCMAERLLVEVEGEALPPLAYRATKPIGVSLLFGHGASAREHDRFIREYAAPAAHECSPEGRFREVRACAAGLRRERYDTIREEDEERWLNA